MRTIIILAVLVLTLGLCLFVMFYRTSPFSPEVIADTDKLVSLLKAGLDPEIQNDSQRNEDTLLWYAVRHRAPQSVRAILDAGAHVDRLSSGFKKTALFLAAYFGDIATA